jgi:hypothetical protein
MNRVTVAATGIACFVLGAFVPLRHTHAQSNNSNRTYYVVDYMKSRPGQDPYKMERDLWKPIHQIRLQKGDISSWAVMTPVLAGPHNYDYITVTGYSSMEAYAKTDEAYQCAA